MRIAVVTAGFPYGPGESFLLPELAEVLRQGHELTIVPLRSGGRVLSAGAASLLGRVRGVSLASPPALAATVRALRHSPGRLAAALPVGLTARTLRGRATNLALLPTACWLARVAEEMGADHLHAYWAAGPASAAMLAARLTGLPWSFTAHRWDIWENNLLARKLRAALFCRLISEDGRRMLGQVLERDGAPADERARLLARAQVVHLGIDLPASPIAEPAEEVVLCPASLLPVKGHRYLIEAFRLVAARRPGALLLLAGDGPLRATLSRQVEHAGLAGRVEFLGHLPHDRLLRLYLERGVRCAALASVTLAPGQHEGIPVGLIEAMGHGVPVVATASGGIPELVRPGHGTLVPERDAPALAEAIERVLAATDWPRLGAAGREVVQESFDARGSAAALLRLMAGT